MDNSEVCSEGMTGCLLDKAVLGRAAEVSSGGGYLNAQARFERYRVEMICPTQH